MADTPRKASPDQLDRLGVRAAARVQPGQRVGLGSGKAALAFVRALGQRVRTEQLAIVGVPTSLLTEQVARDAGVPLTTLEHVDALDIAIDGADEVDPNLNLIKGGGGNLTREKIVESIARQLIIVVGEEKLVPALGEKFPVFVEVIEFGRATVTRAIAALGGTSTPRLNADGTLFLTDNGNPLLHCHFGPAPHHLADPAALDAALHRIPGVVETGLFIGMAEETMVAYADGSIKSMTRPR